MTILTDNNGYIDYFGYNCVQHEAILDETLKFDQVRVRYVKGRNGNYYLTPQDDCEERQLERLYLVLQLRARIPALDRKMMIDRNAALEQIHLPWSISSWDIIEPG